MLCCRPQGAAATAVASCVPAGMSQESASSQVCGVSQPPRPSHDQAPASSQEQAPASSQAQGGAAQLRNTWGSAHAAQPSPSPEGETTKSLNPEARPSPLKRGFKNHSSVDERASNKGSSVAGDSPTFVRWSSHGSSTEGDSSCFEMASSSDADAEEDSAVEIFFLSSHPSWPAPPRHTQGSPQGCTPALDALHAPPPFSPTGPHCAPYSDINAAHCAPYSDINAAHCDMTTHHTAGNVSAHLPLDARSDCMDGHSHARYSPHTPWTWVSREAYITRDTSGAWAGTVPTHVLGGSLQQPPEPISIEMGHSFPGGAGGGAEWYGSGDTERVRHKQGAACQGRPALPVAALGPEALSADAAVPASAWNCPAFCTQPLADAVVPVRARDRGSQPLPKSNRPTGPHAFAADARVPASARDTLSPLKPRSSGGVGGTQVHAKRGSTDGLSEGGGQAATVPAGGARRRRAGRGALGLEALRKRTSLEVIVEGRQAESSPSPLPSALPFRYASLSDCEGALSDGGINPRRYAAPSHSGTLSDSEGAYGGCTTKPTHTPTSYEYTMPRSASLPRHPSYSGRCDGASDCTAVAFRAFDPIDCAPETPLGTPRGLGAGKSLAGPGGPKEEALGAWEGVPKGKAHRGDARGGRRTLGRRVLSGGADARTEEPPRLVTQHLDGAVLAIDMSLQGTCDSERAVQMQPHRGHRNSSYLNSSVYSNGTHNDIARSWSGDGEGEGDSDTSEAGFQGNHYCAPFQPSTTHSLEAPKSDISALANSAVVEALARLACQDLDNDATHGVSDGAGISVSAPRGSKSGAFCHGTLSPGGGQRQLAAAGGPRSSPGPPVSVAGTWCSLPDGSSEGTRGALEAYRSPPLVAHVSKSHSCDAAVGPRLPRGPLACAGRRPILVSPERKAGAPGVHRGEAEPEKPNLPRRVSFDERVAVITYH